jgi:predicted enzyme related to lactoylglutathione lyase
MIKITDFGFSNFAVSDLPRARGFYEGVLGLKTAGVWEFGEGKGWIEYEYPGGTLAITNMWPSSGSGSAGVAFEVADIDAAFAHVKEKGAKVAYDPFDTPVCRGLGLADPDGNSVMLHQRKAAK